MGNRRFAQVSTSDDEEEVEVEVEAARPSVTTRSSARMEANDKKRKKKLNIPDEDEELQEKEETKRKKRSRREKSPEPEEDKEEEEEEEEEPLQEDAKPVGEPVRFSSKGRGRRSHYAAFDFDGNHYELEDPVLLVPEDQGQKPYVAIIKDISQTRDGTMMVTGQWFYRPEEAEKKGGGSWQSSDTRELFYSFHRDEVPAESVMHRCVVHFVPARKQLPSRKQHPGFIVQKVYDTVEQKLWKLTDKDYEDSKQQEINLLVQKTLSRLPDLPDIATEDTEAFQEDQAKAKRTLRKKIAPLDVTLEDEGRLDNAKPGTPGSFTSGSKHYSILVKFNVLTGQTLRDRWLERLLQAVQNVCDSSDNTNDDDNEHGSGADAIETGKLEEAASGSQEKSSKRTKSFIWPDDAVSAVSALEKASNESLSSDFQKYNSKLRQLEFNLKNNSLLARRLLNGELEPLKVLNMTPTELKEGLTADETVTKEPEESERIQTTDAICSRCNEKNVGLRDIIQAGLGARYQLECNSCGNSWYASRDEVSMLTIDGPGTATSVGTAPWATAKFEEVEKKLASPREADKASEVIKKASEPYMPVLETQRSFGKSKNESSGITKNTEL